jgi:hypothetical protein
VQIPSLLHVIVKVLGASRLLHQDDDVRVNIPCPHAVRIDVDYSTRLPHRAPCETESPTCRNVFCHQASPCDLKPYITRPNAPLEESIIPKKPRTGKELRLSLLHEATICISEPSKVSNFSARFSATKALHVVLQINKLNSLNPMLPEPRLRW